MFVDNHHGDGNVGVWCAAPPGDQQALTGENSAVFFRPPYVGGRGWLGVRLSPIVDDGLLSELLTDAWRTIAPKRLLAAFETTDSAGY